MLTPEQNLIVKNYVEADQVLNALPHNNGGALDIANTLNLPTNPAFIVWRTSVSWDTIMTNGMNWTRVDNLQNGNKWRIWEWMFKNAANAINPSKSNVRDGIDATWVGTQQDLNVRAAVYVHCKRTANLIEKILATGTGSNAVPATLSYEGELTYIDIANAMGWEI